MAGIDGELAAAGVAAWRLVAPATRPTGAERLDHPAPGTMVALGWAQFFAVWTPSVDHRLWCPDPVPHRPPFAPSVHVQDLQHHRNHRRHQDTCTRGITAGTLPAWRCVSSPVSCS